MKAALALKGGKIERKYIYVCDSMVGPAVKMLKIGCLWKNVCRSTKIFDDLQGALELSGGEAGQQL